MNKCLERLYNGLIKENPTFVLMLGMCPTLAVTTSAINGAGMGLATTFVLVMSNMLISMLRKIIPDSVRMPAFIVVVATFVTVVQFVLEGFVPSLYSALGVFIPLIVVNCIILGRAEAFAAKNNVLLSAIDGVSMGLGFTLALILLGAIRQFLAEVCMLTFFVSSAGGFMIFGLVMALFNYVITLINNKVFSKKVLLDMQTPVSENAKEVE